ncbi:hypothetical protein [Tabrizicola sp. BL-A-41-H6]|uniref:hypothetical protein n=1 Tax=Tabrizicola sp. BL-A-41-H6 TaxID=3421107 RepID=UPI003D675CDD
MPNSFAYLVLMTWPLVALVLFRLLPVPKALVWTLLGGFLLLPSGTNFDLPMLPVMDKSSIPNISALLMCLIFGRKPAADADAGVGSERRGHWVVKAVLGVLLLAPFFTVYHNPEPLSFGPLTLPGLRLYDAVTIILGILISLIPFFLALRYLGTVEDQIYVLKAFAIAGLLYSLPVLFEVRFSPQLHTWIYGFFPHDFFQHMRDGGYRPVVFLNHGLMIGSFYCMATLAALVLWREALRTDKVATGWLFSVVWLIGVLIISKNLGALVITVTIGVLILFTGRRVQVFAAVIVASLLILYPALRTSGVVPTTTILGAAQSVSEERASSLQFRFDNEAALMARANEKPAFGWGSWGRNQIYDPDSGRQTSVTDGLWIILIGTYGWMGYAAHFGLLTMGIWFAMGRHGMVSPSMVTPGLMMLLSGMLVDFIPNGWLLPYVWLLAGSLTGSMMRGSERRDLSADNLARAPAFGARTAPPAWLAQGASPRARRSDRQPEARSSRTR